jgi:hypothetical protein
MEVRNMANRVLAHAAEVQRVIDSGHKPDGSPLGDIAALDRSLDLDILEVVAWQEAKSLAQMKGILSVEEALTVYTAIGEDGGWAQDTSLALKVTITTLMGQLLPLLRSAR